MSRTMAGEFDLPVLAVSDAWGTQGSQFRVIADIGTPTRLATVVADQMLIADLFPRTAPHDPDPPLCAFKVYDEVAGEDGGRELLIEMKCTLVLEEWAHNQYSLTFRSLRGTDCWRVIQAFAAKLGNPLTMILSDDRHATVYFPGRRPL